MHPKLGFLTHFVQLKKKQEEEERAKAAKLKIEDEQTRTEKMREKLRKDSMEIRELEAKVLIPLTKYTLILFRSMQLI